MEGVLGYLVCGMLLFTPIGFFAGYYQHKRDKKKEESQEIINKQSSNDSN